MSAEVQLEQAADPERCDASTAARALLDFEPPAGGRPPVPGPHPRTGKGTGRTRRRSRPADTLPHRRGQGRASARRVYSRRTTSFGRLAGPPPPGRLAACTPFAGPTLGRAEGSFRMRITSAETGPWS
jgi:hypothetical protein